MVREHKRRKGARRYQDYTDENLEECLDKIKTGKLTQRVAASTLRSIRTLTFVSTCTSKYLDVMKKLLLLCD